jgi:hypothetical protein
MSEEEDTRAEVPPDEASIAAVSDEEEQQDGWHPFEELASQWDDSGVKRVMGPDGLPVVVADVASDIPALSSTSLVCMEDTSKFVRRDTAGNIIEEYAPDEVAQTPDGTWRLKASPKGNDVEPIRRRCEFYARQAFPYQYNPEATQFSRLCSARRTMEGTWVSLSNSGMFACDIRRPRDLASEKLLDDFDQKKIKEGANRVALPMFKPRPVDKRPLPIPSDPFKFADEE